jgi:hypothetical protein
MTSTASRRSSTGWLIGCVVIACLVFAVGGLGFGVLYTQGFFGQEPEPTSTFIPPTFTSVPPPEATPTVVVVDEPLFEDDFSTSAWGTGTDSDSSVEYENQALHFFVNKDFWYVWSTPNEENYEDIHIEVTAVNNSTDPKGSFGIICNLQNADDTSYYFAVTGSGDYAIGRYTLTDDILLTNDGEWAPSSAITPSADSYRVGVDCGNGILNLYVDGQLVDSVSDATFTSGNVGLFAWSDEKQNSTDVTFDDFVVTNLP